MPTCGDVTVLLTRPEGSLLMLTERRARELEAAADRALATGAADARRLRAEAARHRRTAIEEVLTAHAVTADDLLVEVGPPGAERASQLVLRTKPDAAADADATERADADERDGAP